MPGYKAGLLSAIESATISAAKRPDAWISLEGKAGISTKGHTAWPGPQKFTFAAWISTHDLNDERQVLLFLGHVDCRVLPLSDLPKLA